MTVNDENDADSDDINGIDYYLSLHGDQSDHSTAYLSTFCASQQPRAASVGGITNIRTREITRMSVYITRFSIGHLPF